MGLASAACPVVVTELNLASAATAHASSSSSALASFKTGASNPSVNQL
jgi:hypothetical protein